MAYVPNCGRSGLYSSQSFRRFCRIICRSFLADPKHSAYFWTNACSPSLRTSSAMVRRSEKSFFALCVFRSAAVHDLSGFQSPLLGWPCCDCSITSFQGLTLGDRKDIASVPISLGRCSLVTVLKLMGHIASELSYELF
jgi:hypothetical protein